MELTSTLSSLLVQSHSSRPISPETSRLSDSLDSFLREAYQINNSITELLKYLRAIRQPYLSSAPPPRKSSRPPQPSRGTPAFDIPAHLTDAQREEIDSQTSDVLREINGSVISLSSAVQLQHSTAEKVLEKKYGKPTGLLWRWAAGSDNPDPDAGKSRVQVEEEGKLKTQRAVRDGVLWYLNWRLGRAVGLQQDMVEIRLGRERERQMSVLYNERNKDVRARRMSRDEGQLVNGTGNARHGDYGYGNLDLRGKDTYNPALDMDGYGQANGGFLSEAQMQLFEEENAGLLNHYNDQLAKVTQAEKSLLEISSLQQTLVGHLSVQGEMIGGLVEDAANTGENLRRGNKELKRASERSSVARGVFWGTAGLCGFLIIWDMIF